MPSSDFYSDALDCLKADPDGYFFLMYGQAGDAKARWAAFAPSDDHIQFFIDRFPRCVKAYANMRGDNLDKPDNSDD